MRVEGQESRTVVRGSRLREGASVSYEHVSSAREERIEKEDVPDASDQDESPFSLPTCDYRGTSLVRKRTPLGPYRRPMPRVLRGS